MAHPHTHPTTRLEALTDGVFSIALTLLIIEVVAAGKHIEPGETLSDHLIEQWPALVSYLIGFLTILVCWINHHRVFYFVRRGDSGLVWINGLQLALVSAVPLPTALLADHITGPDSLTAVRLYGITFLLMASSFWALWNYVHRRGFTDREVDEHRYNGMGRIYRWAVAWTVAALGVAHFSIWIAIGMWAVMFVVFAFPVEFSRRAAAIGSSRRA